MLVKNSQKIQTFFFAMLFVIRQQNHDSSIKYKNQFISERFIDRS